MSIAIENMPIIFLIIIGIGVAIIVTSVISLAGLSEHTDNYYVASDVSGEKEDTAHLEELFSYFLEEEEKKNDAFRQMVLDQTKETKSSEKKAHPIAIRKTAKQQIDQHTFNEIIKRYEQGEDPQSIAKDLKKGIGEVKLILSLYSMR